MEKLSTESGLGGTITGRSSLSHVVENYIRYYASGSSHTARAKRLDLTKFLSFLQRFHGYSRADKLTVEDWSYSSVQRFVEELLRKGESPATVARRLATVKHMGRTLSERVKGFINPAKDVKSPLIKPLKPKNLSTTELTHVEKKALERYSEKNSFIRLRNFTLFKLLIDTGLRAEEVRLLKLQQLDDELSWISNVRTKGRRYRNVYITSEVRQHLTRYLEARELEFQRIYGKLSKSKSALHPLFISLYGAKSHVIDSFYMGPKSIWRAVHELSNETGLHPHLLRHSYAHDLLDSSNDIRLVAQALGHSDVRVTMRYTERSGEEVAEALEKSRTTKKKQRKPTATREPR